MAKPKKKAAKKTSRRRRIGAMGFNANSPLVKYGSIAAGFLLGDKINAAIDKATGGKIDGKIVAAGELGLGGYLLFFHKGKKNVVLTLLAGVLAGAGVKRGMQSFGIGRMLSGYGMVPVIGNRRMAGYGNVPVLSGSGVKGGYDAGQQLAGYNPQSIAKVMSGVDTGSGITNSGGGGYMS